MALRYTTWSDWVSAAESESRLIEFTKGETSITSQPRLERAETLASEEMLGWLSKRYGSSPFTDMTSFTKSKLLALGLWHLTDYAEARPENIRSNAELARSWLEKVSLGKFTLNETKDAGPEEKTDVTPGMFFNSPRVTTIGGTVLSEYDFDSDNPRSLAAIKLGSPL